MADLEVTEWTLDGVLDEMKRIHDAMKDRQFAFILGAGASFTSGIPTGQHLAQRWLKDLHLRECADGRSLDQWVAECGVGNGGLTLQTAAEHYSQIFERRFDGDREAGYAELEAAMEGKSPSLGYSLLAEIIQDTRHKVVVTTNFDNLVADALAMHAHQSPLVVAHESLAGFVRPQLRRPLVAKIHRDLFLHPINDQVGVSTMEQGWKIALKKLFQYFTPVVVGYGGNDGSLMDMLLGLDQGDIAGRMYWCYREGSPPPEKARSVLHKHRGILVKIPGFDEFMLQLAAKLVTGFDVAAIAERTAKLGQKRAELYRDQASRLRESSARGSPAEQQAGAVITQSVRSGHSWWAWEMRAQAELDLEKRDRIYLEGIKNFPASAELAGSYAVFLTTQRKDYDAAEAMFKRALELDPNDASIAGNYAIFLSDKRKDYDAAQSAYKKALELDPGHANNIGNYAGFLACQRQDYDISESMYKRALELDPGNADIIGNFAIFLKGQRKDYGAAEEMFERALGIDPNHVQNIGSYAVFLAFQRQDYGAAEAMFKRALELDPSDASIAGNYAIFLRDQRKDYEAAEAMFERSLELDPNHAQNIGNYAVFLMSQRQDYGAAEAMFKRALELDPSDASITGNYAILLKDHLNDYEAAEAKFERALELDPNHAQNIGNYAVFLAYQRQDYGAAEAMFKRALELDPSDASITGNYATYLVEQGRDYDVAEAMFEKALDLDSSDAQIMGNYASFLAHQREDYDAAEALYKKAFEFAPNDANHAANFASLLLTKADTDSAQGVLSLVHRVIELSWPALTQTLAEALLYGALVEELAPTEASAHMLRRLKGVLGADFSRGIWDFTRLFESVLPKLELTRRELFQAIGDAILYADKVTNLEAIEAWRELEAVHPYAAEGRRMSAL